MKIIDKDRCNCENAQKRFHSCNDHFSITRYYFSNAEQILRTAGAALSKDVQR